MNNAVAEPTPSRIQFPVKLQPLFRPARYKVLHGGRGGAKCLAIGTRVIMFDGSLRAVELIQTGELVMGPDGKPRVVLGTTRGHGPLYRVSQTSGMAYVVNEDHILSLKKSLSAKRDIRLMPSGNPRSPRGRYPDWDDVTNIPVLDFQRKSARWKAHFFGYRAGLIPFEKQGTLIDPYFLGLWLGDGTSRELRITSADPEVIEYCQEYARLQGGTCSINGKVESKAKDIGICLRRGRLNLLWESFKAYGLKNNKHIPQSYLANAEDVRLSLLAGLIDSDGTKHHGGYVIAQVNERLAREIKYLADTLGFRTSLNLRRTICCNNGVRGKAWAVSISGDTWRIPCRVKRKQIATHDIRKNKNFLLSVVSVEPCGVGDWAGFALDGDHLFLLEDGTVTHNSWGIARALLLLGAKRRLRILCTREIQRSIRDSVHKLLSDQVEALGLGAFYTILEHEIRGQNGTEFIFSGLSSQTVESIKSYEGVDICWVEEAQNVSGHSWKILTPTIRKAGSEIWISFNPELDTDETYRQFVTNAPDDSIVIEIGYQDNPWFPAVLEAERLHCLATNPDEYDNIWEGKCKAAVSGAIYAKEVMQAVKDGRICHVPYDPRLKVHTIWDLGLDTTAIIMVQKGFAELRLINYIQDKQLKLDHYAAELQKLNYNWGWDWLPHDGHAENVRSFSAYRILKSFGRRVKPKIGEKYPIPNLPVEVGIRAVRLLYPRLVIDKTKCALLLEAHKRYRRNIPVSTGEPATPIHDQYSHGCDATRYLALIADQLTNDEELDSMPKGKPYRPVDVGMGALG